MARHSSLVDHAGRPMVLPTRPRAGAYGAYDAGDPVSQDLGGWLPALYSPDSAYLPERERISSRLHDLVRNDGWAGGAVTTYVNNAIGAAFRLSSKPDARALGISFEEAAELGREIEMIWRNYGNDPRRYCDARRQASTGGLFYQLFRHRIVDGECLVLPGWRPVDGVPYATMFQVVHPARLSNPYDGPDSDRLRAGVELGAYGEPVAYHIRRTHPGDRQMLGGHTLEWTRVEREWPWGRPQVIHYFRPDEAEQTRGISPFAPIVRRLRMSGRYEGAEMQAAVANAVLAAYIETSLPPEAAGAILDDRTEFDKANEQRLDFYDAAPVRLNGMRIPVLPVGDKVSFPMAARPNREASAFVDAGLRNLAAATGLNPSQISRNYANTNYSSERAAMVEAWKAITVERQFFAAGVATPMLLCLLEEALDRGMLKLPAGAPAFWEAPAAYLRGYWIGPGRGWVDPTKEAQGSLMRMDAFVGTLESENAEQGLDWEETLEQQALERRRRNELGLPSTTWAVISETDDTADGEEEEGNADV